MLLVIVQHNPFNWNDRKVLIYSCHREHRIPRGKRDGTLNHLKEGAEKRNICTN